MSLSSLNLDAFQAVAQKRGFSAAAKALSLTQSALSQRVLNLEKELGSTLFLRDQAGIRLTDLGNKLLRYCQSKESLEREFLAPAESGILRLAGFSTVHRSILLPVAATLAREFPAVEIQAGSFELRELPGILASGRADFIFVTQALEKQGVENTLLGHEEYVLVRPTAREFRENTFLDHDAEDTTTEDFFRFQGKKAAARKRSYLGEIYSILEGVKLGLGRAVVPLHLAAEHKGVEVVTGFKPFRVPVYLTYYTQSYYTQLQKTALERITREFAARL